MSRSPQRVGPYEIDSRIGAGGMAETYRATRRGPGEFVQQVCLKRIRPDLDDNPDFVRQFLAEARIAATLRHASIAQVLDFGQDGDDYYLALELIDGVDLRELLDQHREGIGTLAATHIGVELASALAVAHRAHGAGGRGIVHRDVSPANVLISTEGEVKLTDFGIARSIGGQQHTATGMVKGKIPYMAPEYARTGAVSERIDLFALGVVLYECLTGRRPYAGATDVETFERASAGRHPALLELAPETPPVLAELVEELIRPDPATRPASATEVIERLSHLPTGVNARRLLSDRVRPLRDASRQQQDLGSADTAAAAPPSATRSLTLSGAERTRTSAPDPSPEANPGRGSVRRPVLAASALAVAAAALAAFYLPAEDSAPAPRPTPTAAPGRSKEAATAAQPDPRDRILRGRGVEAPTELSADPTDAAAPAFDPAASTSDPGVEAAPSDPRSARVKVVVLPYGEVFIDGTSHGNAPVTTRLPPGWHRFEAQTPSGRIRRRVQLRAGTYRSIKLE